MSLATALFHPQIIIALLCYGALSLTLVWAARRADAWLHHNALTAWLTAHIYLPLARAALLLLFIALAYPVLFGLNAAPPLSTLLTNGNHHFSHIINLTFLLSLLLPLLPVIGTLPSLVLPLQGISAAALLFHWLGAEQGIAATLFPGWATIAVILIWIYVGHRLALAAAHRLGGWANARFEIQD